MLVKGVKRGSPFEAPGSATELSDRRRAAGAAALFVGQVDRREKSGAFELSPLPAGEQLREDVHHEHEGNQDESCRPGGRLVTRVW